MPDVFIDRFLKIENIEKFTSEIYEKSKVGGGSIRGYEQRDIIGGNAINFAKTISKLGGNVNLFVIGNEFIKRDIESLFGSEKSNINIIEGRPGYTTALEIQNENNKVNIMFSDVGDLKKFNGDELDNEELENIAESNASVIVNWSSINEGNKLIKKIFSNRKNSNSINFLDLADPKSVTNRLPLRAVTATGSSIIAALGSTLDCDISGSGRVSKSGWPSTISAVAPVTVGTEL